MGQDMSRYKPAQQKRKTKANLGVIFSSFGISLSHEASQGSNEFMVPGGYFFDYQ